MIDSNIPGNPGDDRGNGSGNDFLILGIGASAGGINALREFFENVPQFSGIAYVVILHLSPQYDAEQFRACN